MGIDLVSLMIGAEVAGGGGSDITVEPLSVRENGSYQAESGKAYSPVTVNVPQTEIEPLTVQENGTTTAPEGKAYSPVTVNVPQTTIQELNVSENGDYAALSGTAYSPVHVAVPNSYAASDEGKVVENGGLVFQSSRTVTDNGTYDTTKNNEVVVNIPSAVGVSF